MTIQDKQCQAHTLQVQILSTEETTKSPNLILAAEAETGARIVFSQIQLEEDASKIVDSDVLKKNELARLEIFHDILASHLGLCTQRNPSQPLVYTPGYLLGSEETKLKLLEKLRDKMDGDVLKNSKLEMEFCDSDIYPRPASDKLLPILMNESSLTNFRKEEYFKVLTLFQ